jgi:predicted CopG family antitoxin
VTIKIERSTLQLLEEMKEETKSKNFDEVIRKLTKRRLPKSMFGAHPEISSFTEKDEIRFHEL